MANMILKGTGVIGEADFHTVKYTGKTKGGDPIVITIKNALNKGNIDWTFAEKDDTVATVEFEGGYDNTDAASTSTEEPFTIECSTSMSGAASILLGVGVFSIDDTDIALTRGGGKFTVEREFREINADGDRGMVQGRVTIESSRPKIQLNALTMLGSMAALYPAIGATPAQ